MWNWRKAFHKYCTVQASIHFDQRGERKQHERSAEKNQGNSSDIGFCTLEGSRVWVSTSISDSTSAIGSAKSNLTERYAFPAEIGPPTRGVPTSYAAPPLSRAIADAGGLPPVWPCPDGKVRGYSFVPLHKNVPEAALADERPYELLALVDAIRNGRAR